MRNEGAVVIRKATTAIGVGLIEEALENEGRKGCSPILCTEPVNLEPLFQRFDAPHILTPPQEEAHQSQQEQTPQEPATSKELVTFNIYPAEQDLLSITWMETMLRALAVLPGPMAFELYSSSGKVWVRFAIPQNQVPGFRTGILGHFPALRLEPVHNPFPDNPPASVNELYPVGPYHRSLTLLGKEGASPLGLATIVLSELEEGQHGLFQVLLQPASPKHDWHYNIENMIEAEHRAGQLAQLGGLSTKFSYDPELPPLLEPSVREKARVDVAFLATLARYAVWNTDQNKTEAFLQGMRVASGMLRFGNRAWRVLNHSHLEKNLDIDKVQEMVAQRLSHRPGLMLTSREVASLVHIPNARTLSMLASIQQRHGFEWRPFKEKIQSANLGANYFAGQTKPVQIPTKTRLRQTYIAGTTGSGKSKLIERMAVDDAINHLGLCLVDPHGDLCLEVLSRLPKERVADLVYISFSEQELVPRWNPFQANVPPGKLADDIARAFLAQTSTTGPRMEHNFRMLAYVVHELQGTLDDFAELAGRSHKGNLLREKALASIANPQVQRFLRNELPSYGAGEMASVTNKLSRLLLDDQLGTMLSQKENKLNPRQWMDQGKIVLINLSSGHIGADHARFVGSLLVSLLYRAALTRSELQPEKRRPFILYIDEFQQLQSATLAEILSEGRKYGLGAVLAHQERGQLRKELGQAIGNCATKIIFRPGEDDIPYFHRLLGGLEPDSLRGLGVGEAIVVCGSRLASLTTELCQYPRIRDPRQTARNYAKKHYLPVSGEPTIPRPRVYDTFGE